MGLGTILGSRLSSKLSSKLIYVLIIGINKVGTISSPLNYILTNSGNLLLKKASYIFSISELVFLKLPFIITYLSKTRDFDVLWYWISKEILTTTISLFGLLDLCTYIVDILSCVNRIVIKFNFK